MIWNVNLGLVSPLRSSISPYSLYHVPSLLSSVFLFLILYFPLPKILANRLIDNCISAVELIIPPKTPGPPPHWLEMHDETFLVTKGTVRFHDPEVPGLEGENR